MIAPKANRILAGLPIPMLALAVAMAIGPATTAPAQQTATGIVYRDDNANGRFDAGDKPVENVLVSNGFDVVKTNGRGRYTLPVTDDTVVFVIKPRGYRTPLNDSNLPVFHYVHKPHGSPRTRYPGVAPTGPLPDGLDFPLYPQKEPDTFRAVVFADTQTRDQKEIDFLAHDVVEELVGVDAAFGVTLGDIVFNDLNLYEDLNAVVAQIGIPWHNVIGNHDTNADADEDELSDETFERVFGPNYYAFQYGPIHFIAMDTVIWSPGRKSDDRKYRGGIDADQLQFIENYLGTVPKDELIVLLMHIPLPGGSVPARERNKLFALLADRPHTLSLSGHTHDQGHVFMDRNEGWLRDEPHHHLINATTCGSWWGGAPDELGIPHTTMRDGGPNGYSIVTFNKADYTIGFKAARRPAEFQMSIFAPEEIDSTATGTTEVIVNVFAGSEKTKVEMRVDDNGPWTLMTRFRGMDPYYRALKQMEESATPPAGRKLPEQDETDHLWKAALPDGLAPGRHTIHVRAVDFFGKTHTSARVFAIRGETSRP